MGVPSHILLDTSENGYPVSDNRTLNCEGIIPSPMMRWVTIVAFTRCAPPTKIPNCLSILFKL